MALTKVSTDGVKDDAITKAKIPADQIEASELADNAVDTNAITDNAVSSAKITTNAVTQAKIADDAVGADQLASNAVVTASIADNAITQAKINVPISNRNLIINGAMQVAQRATSATGTGFKTIDRFGSIGAGSQAVTQSQDTDVPTGQGFSKSLKYDCTTANASPNSGDYLSIRYKIEAQDLQQIANGTSSAKKVTISFWVKSPKTGNHALGIYKYDNTQRQNTKTYSVSAANTWEKKTITYDGDTSGGGIDNDNGAGFAIDWHLLSGSDYTAVDSTSWINYASNNWAYGHAVNVLDNTANNFYITGVQLEVGSTATDFEHRSYAQELALCQRYFYKPPINTFLPPAYQYYPTARMSVVEFPTTMRATPTCIATWNTAGSFTQYYNSASHFKAYVGSSYDSAESFYLSSFQASAEL